VEVTEIREAASSYDQVLDSSPTDLPANFSSVLVYEEDKLPTKHLGLVRASFQQQNLEKKLPPILW